MNFPLFQSLRPRQWTKNLVVFAGLFFSEKGLVTSISAWLNAGLGFLIFCGLSGTVYLLNDLVDIENDRVHPEKCKRPLASGALSVGAARVALGVLLVTCLGVAWRLPALFFGSAVAYFLVNLAYSFRLKHVVILDVLCIAVGFVLRALAGVGTLRVIEPQISMSPWLLLCTLLLAMFLGLVKRRQEIFRLEENASAHRRSLEEYSLPFIDKMVSVVCGATLIAYSLYTVSPETIRKFGTEELVYTVPVVLYGIFRYLYLIHIRNLGDNPSEIILTDRPMQATLLVWIVMVFVIIHLPHLSATAP